MLQAIKNGNKAFARRLIALKATIFTSGNKSNSSHNNNNNNKNNTNNNSSETSEKENSPTPQLQNQQQQKQLVNKLSVSEMSEISKSSSNNSTAPANNDGESGELIKTGWLLKWTNYLKGYQKRWFVLSNGVLSYYRYVNNKNSQGFSLHIFRVYRLISVLHILFFFCFNT